MCSALAENLFRGEGWYIITLTDLGSVCSIAGLLFAVFAFAYTNRKKK